MPCGSCVRFKNYGAMDGTLGHCSYAGKNVNTTDPACEGYIDENILEVFEGLFLNRVDTYGEQREDGQYVRRDEPLTTEVLKRHLAGEITVGAYQIEPGENVVKWLCFDIDPERTETPHKVAAQICDLARQSFTEKSVLLEASRHPDPSFHIWVFFEPEIPAKVPRVLGAKILEKAGIDIEVFPKQNEVKEGEFGNLVKLPLGLHCKEKKWSCFLDPSSMSPLSTSTIVDVEGTTLTEREIQKVMGLSEKGGKVWFERDDLAERKYRGKDPACIQGLMKGVTEGWRNETALRLSSYMLNFKKLKYNTAWKRLLDWNKQNKPPLDERELERIFNSTVKGEYIFGCDDELLQKFCVREGCSLAKELSGIELVQQELEKQKAVQLHPLIDYHPNTGLTIGALLGKSSQALIFMREKAFTVEFETPLLEEISANSISVNKPKWASLMPHHKKQMLLLAGDCLSGKQIVFPSKKEVFQKAFGKVSYYYWHSDERWIIVVTCWIIATYFHVIYVFFPALCLQGERETGKSTLLEVLRKIAWNPTGREVALREADLFRTIEGSRVTYLADITKLNPKSKSYQDVIDVFETGTEKGGCVRRINKDTEEPINFMTYGPKAVATRYELPFLPKTIRIITEKAENPIYSGRRGEIEFDEEFPEIVGLLIKGAIKYWPKVVEAYKNMKQTEKLRGRPFNYWSPVLAICKVFAPQHYDSVLKLAEEEAEKAERGDRLSEVEECVLTLLFEFKGEATKCMLLKELTKQVQDRVPWVKDWHIVRSAVTNLGIAKRYYSTGKGKAYEFDLERAGRKAEARGITVEEAPPETEEIMYGHCEVCGKPAAPGHLRNGRWRYVHKECEKDWQGPL